MKTLRIVLDKTYFDQLSVPLVANARSSGPRVGRESSTALVIVLRSKNDINKL